MLIKNVYFGQASASDFTIHILKDEQTKQRYINRHKNNENWSKSGWLVEFEIFVVVSNKRRCMQPY
jgi:hypothetical protein